MPERLIPRDVVIENGATQELDDDVFVNGWVTVRNGGQLICKGNVTCLGMSVENDGLVRCNELATNVLEVERAPSGKPPRFELTRIRARVVHHVQLALRDLVDKDVVIADYIQHFGGELNPSWDYVRGNLPLAEEFYEERADDAPVVFEIALMQEALRTGKSIFKRMKPLVEPRSRATVAAATRHPLVEQLKAWLEAHAGPQRATLEALEAEWLPKLTSLPADAHDDVVRVVKQVIKSPKLSERVEALRTRL